MAESSLFVTIDEDARRRFESAWDTGNPLPIEDFLPAPDQRDFLPTLEELVHIEMEMAWKRGSQRASNDATVLHQPRLESYLKRFPQLRQKEILERLIRQEIRVRHHCGDQPTVKEYAERFPDVQLDVQAGDTGVQDSQRTVDDLPRPVSRPTSLPNISGYEIMEVLGRGGMAVVYKARQKSLHRLVAVKMIRGGASEPEEVSRFRTEAEAVARLQHPNIVQIFEVSEHEGEPFFSLEFVNGGSLARCLKDTTLAPRAAAELVAALARAIHYAHEHGIIHRDLKPANILISVEGPGAKDERQGGKSAKVLPHLSALGTPKISDFGLAKRLEDTTGQTRTGAVMGTPSYMAPEQAAGKTREVGPAADIYALGAILYEAITGQPPFKGDSVLEVLEQVRTREPTPPTRLQPKLHRDLEVICLKALAKDPRQRYATARALADDLERFSSGEPILARPISRLQRTWHRIRRRPLAVTATLAVIGLCAVLAVWFWQWRQGQQERDLSAEKNRLIQEIEPALVQPELSLASLRRTAARIDNLGSLDAKQAQRKHDHFHNRIKQILEATLISDPGPEPAQLAEIDSILGWLEQTAPDQVKSVRQLQANRKSGWRAIAHLTAPLDPKDRESADVLGDAQAFFKDSAGRTSSGLPPLAYTKVVSLAQGEASAVFKPAWEQAAQIGLWLNAVIGHTGSVSALAFSSDGKTLLSAGGSISTSEVIAWDAASGRPRWVFNADKPGALSVAYSSAEAIAVGNSATNAIAIIDAASGKVVRQLKCSPASGVTTLACSPDGTTLAVGVNGKTQDIQLWDTATWQKKVLEEHSRPVGRIIYSPDSQLLATCRTNGQVKIWNLANQQELFATADLGTTDFLPNARFTSDSRKLIGTGNIGKKPGVPNHLFEWDRASGRAVQDLDIGVHSQTVGAIAMTSDGQAAISSIATGAEAVLLYDLIQKKQVRELSDKAVPAAPAQVHRVIEYSPQAAVLATGTTSGKVMLFDPANSVLLKTFERLGYGFVIRPATIDEAGRRRDSSLESVRRNGGKFSVAILRHDVVLNEQVVHAAQLPAGPLKILAKRQGAKLTLQVNDLAMLEFQDLLPWSDGGAGLFALQCAGGVALERLSLSRRELAVQPSPLERGDALFAAGQLDQARETYRALALSAGTTDIGKEAQFKLAASLLALERREEAAETLEKLVSDSGSRWAAVAGCQLLLLRIQQGKLDDADAILEVLSYNHKIEELRPLVSKDLQNQLTRFYVRDFLGAELLYKLRTTDSRNLERIMKLFDFFKVPREERFLLEISALRAFHRAGELDKANRLVDDILSLDYWVREDNRIPFLRQVSWLFRQQGKHEQALSLVDRYLYSGASERQQLFIHLAPERARILAALDRTAEAEKEVDSYLAGLLPTFYTYFGSGYLLQGFLRQQRGDEAGALESWRRGTHKNWCAEMTKLDARFTASPLGRQNTSDVLVGMITASLADDLPDEEAAAVMAQIAQRASGEAGFAILRDRFPAGLMREMWQTPRGLDSARKMAMLDVTYDEYLRLPLVLALSEYIRAGGMPAKLSADQDAVLWGVCEKLHHEYVSAKFGVPQFLALTLTWKGTTNFLGWDGIAPSLDPKLRGPLAYVVGFRYLRLLRPDDARRFFETALRDGIDNPMLQRLAQAEIDRLKK